MLSLQFNVTAFPSDPLRQLEGQVDVTVYCSKLCEEQHAHLVLRSALAAQQRILEYHVLSEERCQPPSRDNVFHKAVQAVHKRALEGYFLGSRKPVLPAKTREHITTMFIDTLLMYVLQAISEQLLHTPELLNAVYHIMREKKRLHYGALCQILDVYTNSSDPYGGLMLDDINDAISRSLAPDVSVQALEDSLGEVTRKSLFRRHVYPLRGLTAMIKLIVDFRSSVELKAIVAYLAYGAYTGDLKYRLEAFVSDTAAMHAVGHAISEILAIFNFFYIRMDWDRAEQFVRILLGLLISTFVATVGKKLGSDWVGRGYLGGRLVWLLFLRNNGKPWMPFLRAPRLFPTNPKSKCRSTLMRKMTFKHRLCYWLCVLGFCFVFEYYFVFSVLEGITVDSLCASRCDRAIWGSKCVACLSGAGALYVMISSLLCVDMLMGNVLFTCLWGMKLGMSQGISGMRKSADSAVFLSDSTRGLGKDTARHGCLMQHIFGEHWRSIWNLLCYRLWKEDLLNTLETDELMQMAAKGNSEKNRDVPLHLSDLHTIVRERLSFFFASLRFICEGERTRHASGLISEDAVVVGGEKQRERKFVHHGICRMSDVLPLSQIIPAVDEEVILSELFLKGDRGRNLKWIIGKYKREWMHLTLRLSETNLVNRFVDESVSPSVSPQARQEVRVWASMRSQTVLRTVQGAVNYHIALESNPAVFSPHSDISKRSQLERFVELIWAHQTHGDNNARDRDVRWTLMEYADYPIFLVFESRHAPLDLLRIAGSWDRWCA